MFFDQQIPYSRIQQKAALPPQLTEVLRGGKDGGFLAVARLFRRSRHLLFL